MDIVFKHCPHCHKDKPEDDFAPVVKTSVSGEIKVYRRNKCRKCTWGNSKYVKPYRINKEVIEDFNYVF